MKKMVCVIIASVFMISMILAAGNSENTTASDGKIELRISWWGGDARHEKYRQMLDNYELKNPGIKIVREFSGFDGYFDKLAVQAASNNLPDVVHMHLTKVSDYAERGALLPLDDFVENGTIDLSNFNQAIIDSGKIDGKIYMVTLGNSITGCYYNETELERLGFNAPDMDWTWEECFDYCVAVKKKLNANTWVIYDGSTNDTAFDFYLRQKGKSLYTSDGKLGFEKQDLIDWLEMWQKFRDAGITPPMAITAEEVMDAHGDSLLAKKRVLMRIFPANQLAIYQGYMTDILNIVRVPGSKMGNGEFVEGAYVSIANNTKYPEESAKLINYLVNDEDAVKIFGAEHGALGSSKMNEVLMPYLSDANKIVIEFTQYASQYSSPRNAVPASGAEVTKLLTVAGQSVGFGTPVEKAADEFFSQAEKVLK